MVRSYLQRGTVMKSMTKFSVSEDVIKKLFTEKNLGAVTKIVTLTAWEFNSSYSVTSNGRE